MSTPEHVRRYFEVAAGHDLEAYVALFATDAVVEDDGTVRHGLEQVRAWRSEVPDVRYDLRTLEREGARDIATVDVSGEFPGSPVTLGFAFDLTPDGLIRRLMIGVA